MAGPLIAIWSPKGGVGKTLIAAGLAMHLVRRHPNGALLIDLDASKADIAPLLKTATRPSILDYPSGIGATVAHPSGLAVLPGPARLIDEGLVTGGLVTSVLDRARAEDFAVVADLDADLRDSTIITLERADAVLLVVTPDLLSLYPARRFTQEAELINLKLDKFRLVINRTTKHQEITEGEIKQLVPLKPAGKIPSLPALAAAVNRGMTSAVLRTNQEFAQAMAGLADNLLFAGIPSQAAPELNARDNAGLADKLKRWWQT